MCVYVWWWDRQGAVGTEACVHIQGHIQRSHNQGRQRERLQPGAWGSCTGRLGVRPPTVVRQGAQKRSRSF